MPGTLQFATTALTVDESAGTASFSITRTGGSDGAVSVTLERVGTATAGADYTIASNAVSFAAGDAVAKNVIVNVANDADAEETETLTIRLVAPTGGATIGANPSATLTITDNDTQATPQAPQLGDTTSTANRLSFTWQSVAGATSYRLMQDPDGDLDEATGFAQIAERPATATGTVLDVSVHRLDWINSRYRVDACNAQGCTPSEPIAVLDAMLGAIGYFKASNTGQEDRFGFAVALSGDGTTMAIAAPRESSDTVGIGQVQNDQALNSGAVYVFRRVSGQWTQEAFVKASNTGAGDVFGSALALSADGNTLAVGASLEDASVPAPESDNSATNAGAVYVFARTGAQWVQQDYLKAFNAGASDQFGLAIALSGDGKT
ncbi:MAG: Calx-beta domain-containing protein, partial [Steroidobacteraceae bacterium]